MILVESLHGKLIETLEYLDKKGEIDELKESFLDKGAIQCGYCSPGMLISLVALFVTASIQLTSVTPLPAQMPANTAA